MNEELYEIIRRFEQKLDEVHRLLKVMPTPTVEYKQLVSDDADLDSKYGDPVVKYMAKNWQGKDLTGWKFSDCPPEYLDMHAHMLDYFAKKDAANPEKAKNAVWRAKDAARARGWAERLRKRMSDTTAAMSATGDWDDAELPF